MVIQFKVCVFVIREEYPGKQLSAEAGHYQIYAKIN